MVLNNNMNEDTPTGQGQSSDPNLAKMEQDLAFLKQQKAQEETATQTDEPSTQPAVAPPPAQPPDVSQPPQTPPPAQTFPTEKESPRGGGGSLIKVGIALLILAVLALVAYFAGNFISSSRQIQPSPTPLNTTTPISQQTPISPEEEFLSPTSSSRPEASASVITSPSPEGTCSTCGSSFETIIEE